MCSIFVFVSFVPGSSQKTTSSKQPPPGNLSSPWGFDSDRPNFNLISIWVFAFEFDLRASVSSSVCKLNYARGR